MIKNGFKEELTCIINKYSVDNYYNIPDFILAEYIIRHLENMSELHAALNNWNYKDDYDDSMDGDHASALASIGHGTDEDYGSYGGNED